MQQGGVNMDQNFWMNPRQPMGAQWQGNAGLLPERVQTRERVEPQWNLPWQGNADFLTGVPNTDQREGFQYDIGIDGNTESFNFDEELTPEGMEAFRRRGDITPEVPQTQRPARRVVPFPEGESLNKTPIANNFMDRVKELFTPGGEDHGREFNVPETPQAWHPQFRSPSSPAYKTYGHPKMAY